MKEILKVLDEIKQDIPDFSDRVSACSEKIELYLKRDKENKDLFYALNSMLRDLVIDLDNIDQDGLADDLHMLL